MPPLLLSKHPIHKLLGAAPTVTVAGQVHVAIPARSPLLGAHAVHESGPRSWVAPAAAATARPRSPRRALCQKSFEVCVARTSPLRRRRAAVEKQNARAATTTAAGSPCFSSTALPNARQPGPRRQLWVRAPLPPLPFHISIVSRRGRPCFKSCRQKVPDLIIG